MSKLIDKFKQLSPAELQPMGFRAQLPVSPKPKMLLIAGFTEADIEGLTDYVSGADAGLLTISKRSTGIKNLQKITKEVSDIPWGVWLEGSQEEINEIGKTGCDFVVFPAVDTPLSRFQGDEVGKILEVESSISEGLLRAVNELPVDAVLIDNKPGEDYLLTWHQLALFRRFTDLLTKPLLVSIPSNVTAGELQALCDVGVNGVVVSAGVEPTKDLINQLRHLIDNLVPPRRRRKVEALLPRVGGEISMAAEEVEEEDE